MADPIPHFYLPTGIVAWSPYAKNPKHPVEVTDYDRKKNKLRVKWFSNDSTSELGPHHIAKLVPFELIAVEDAKPKEKGGKKKGKKTLAALWADEDFQSGLKQAVLQNKTYTSNYGAYVDPKYALKAGTLIGYYPPGEMCAKDTYCICPIKQVFDFKRMMETNELVEMPSRHSLPTDHDVTIEDEGVVDENGEKISGKLGKFSFIASSVEMATSSDHIVRCTKDTKKEIFKNNRDFAFLAQEDSDEEEERRKSEIGVKRKADDEDSKKKKKKKKKKKGSKKKEEEGEDEKGEEESKTDTKVEERRRKADEIRQTYKTFQCQMAALEREYEEKKRTHITLHNKQLDDLKRGFDQKKTSEMAQFKTSLDELTELAFEN